MYIMFSSF